MKHEKSESKSKERKEPKSEDKKVKTPPVKAYNRGTGGRTYNGSGSVS